MIFSEDSRVKIPCILYLVRLGYQYLSLKGASWDEETNNLVLLTRLKQPAQRLAYTQAAIAHGWSRNVLNIHIETSLLERTGQEVTNFNERLPARGSDLARQSPKARQASTWRALSLGLQPRLTSPTSKSHPPCPTPVRYHRFFWHGGCFGGRDRSVFQYIVTTTKQPPTEFQKQPWLRLELRGAPSTERLLRCDLP